jgi:hypothetical protein
MTEHILIGHFLLRSEAARRAGISTEHVVQRPDLLRIGGTWLEEVYFEFQFDEFGIRHDLGSTVQLLRRTFDDLAIAEWLACPNDALGGATPLRLLLAGGKGAQMAAATADADLRGTVERGR